jgi:hypothetical protein
MTAELHTGHRLLVIPYDPEGPYNVKAKLKSEYYLLGYDGV